ncbi:MAG: hypothetical protein J6B92_09530 [Paraprevotella sp.]|nr:hypothetical protein [Paraprevotella sp.]
MLRTLSGEAVGLVGCEYSLLNLKWGGRRADKMPVGILFALIRANGGRKEAATRKRNV